MNPSDLSIENGQCIAIFAYDVGFSIHIEKAERRITTIKERERIKRTRAAPDYFDYQPPPLRIIQEQTPVNVGNHQTLPTIETVLYDFGAMMVMYRIPFQGSFSTLLPLSEALYEHQGLLKASQTHVQHLLETLEDGVEKPELSPLVEDYVIFHILKTHPSINPSHFLAQYGPIVAQILRCEDQPLSEQEIRDATGTQISFGTEDLVLIDWNAALVIGQEMDDVRGVLEFANVELVERRFLDQQLDKALDEAYSRFTKQPWDTYRWPASMNANLRHIAGLQMDSAMLFERVTNTLKLFGDQYLARVYRMTSQRFHLQSWDTSIVKKLETLENLYGKMAASAGNRRMEILEWIIIILIAISILLPFIPGFPGY
jgi:hypothetical protein